MVGVTSGGGGADGESGQAASAKTDVGYEVRWDEGQKLFRVWNPAANAWVSVPGFSDERIARAVADGLTNPPQGRRGGGEAGKRG